MSLLKLCRCGKVISLADKCCKKCQGKAEEHEEERNRHRHRRYDKTKRDKRARQFYVSKPWQMTRLRALVRDNYLCVKCMKNKRISEAAEVDHIIPLRIDWELRLTLSNLQSLCRKCHARKTSEDKREYRGLR